MKKLDQYVIETTQAGYLWLLDYFGVYRATLEILFLAISATVRLAKHNTDFLFYLCNLVLLLSTLFNYYMQNNGLYTQMNLHAMAYRDIYKARLIIVIAFGIIPMTAELAQHDYLGILHDLGFVCWVYMISAMVRDREPKTFFKKHSLAFSGAS